MYKIIWEVYSEMADSHNLLQKDSGKYPKTQLQLIPVFYSTIERLHMMSQHSNSLATAILVHNENLLRLRTKMLPFPWQKNACKCHSTDSRQPSSPTNGHTPVLCFADIPPIFPHSSQLWSVLHIGWYCVSWGHCTHH